MFYEAELRFLCDTFAKCRIPINLVDLATPLQDLELYPYLTDTIDSDRTLAQVIPAVKPETIYKLTDPLSCRYTYLLLPELPRQMLLAIGPYLSCAPSRQQIMEQAELHGFSPARHIQLERYYSEIPILPESSHLFMLLDTFAERLWGCGSFSVEDVSQTSFDSISVLAEKKSSSSEKDALRNMKSMEQRYAFENELMDAVSRGHTHKADLLLNNLSTFSFEQRAADPVRNAQNYCIIMNTLLRKAAEKGGVHPVYLDSISSDCAATIEQITSLEVIGPLMAEMFRAYCRLVRTHSMKDYSPLIQKAVTYIDANLAGDLGLRSLAETLGVSSSYLSSLFRQDTGQTLTDYINRRRIKYAMHLLETTRLQVQTVAQHCGIVDVQYFSKVFKRQAGMTPKEYRASLKR